MGSSSGWFVALGSFLSIIGGLATAFLSQRWATKREASEREAASKTKWNQLQLEWLIELQNSIIKMIDVATTLNHPDGGKALVMAHCEVLKLIARINDDETKKIVDKLVKDSYGIKDSEQQLKDSVISLIKAQSRIGELIHMTHDIK